MAGVPVKKTPEGIAESSQEEADRQAIERGEDDGMIVYQSAPQEYTSIRNLNDIAEQ